MVDWNASGLVPVFAVESRKAGEEWEPCCGYFDTREQAQAEVEKLRTIYPFEFCVVYSMLRKEEVS